MNRRRPEYRYRWVGAVTWAAATTTATVLAVNTSPDVLSWARQGGGPITVQRDVMAMIAPTLVGTGGMILLIAFAVRAVVARRFALVALPDVFRALRADAGIIVLSACAFMMLHLVQTMTTHGSIASEDLVIAVRFLSAGLAVGGALFVAGTLRGFAPDNPLFLPQLVAAVGVASAGVLGLAVSATDDLTAAVSTAAVAALGGAFTSLVLSIRNLAREERRNPPHAPE